MRRPCRSLGFYILGAGVLLIFAAILPLEWWWMLLGLLLVLIGFLICRC